MRVLFATTAGAGHFGPMQPLARACTEAGHEVAVAAPASFSDAVARAGFTHAGFADVPPDVMGAVFARLPDLPREEANAVVLTEVFGRLDAQAALPGVTATVRDWHPDLVVREPCELASLVAAEAAGVPHVQLSIGMSHAEAHMGSRFVEPLAELAELGGVDPEVAAAALVSMPRLSSVPEVLDEALPDEERLPGLPVRGPLHRFRPALPEPTGALPASWGDDAQPLVYVTFGSVTATLGPLSAAYPTALRELADSPVRVLMTTGDGLDPADLGPLPANVHVESWWPQQDVLPHAAAVVGHGGFGTTMAAVAAGVPQVVTPLFAHDQFVNAAHIAAIGAGVHVPVEPDSFDGLAAAVADVTQTPSYRERAGLVAAEVERLPPASARVGLLEELAAT